MKSKYVFEKMELDGQIVAVPVGENASDLHAVLNLNEEAMSILECLKENTTEEDIVKNLLTEYDSTEAELQPMIHAFIEQLRTEGLLEE